MRTLAPALAALALAACATPEPPPPAPFWHATAQEADWHRDRYECIREASMAAPPSQRVTSTGGYMAGGIWIPAQIQSHDDSAGRRSTLARMCLEARGWRQSPTDPWAGRRAPGSSARLVR